MITLNKITIGFSEGVSLLEECDLLKSINSSRKMNFDKSKFSKEFISISQGESYKEIYDTAMNKGDYDILLVDNSFFQFSYEESNNKLNQIRYAYYNVPYEVETYKEFLNGEGFSYNDVEDEFIEIYEQYIAEAELKNQVIPIRYDYDLKGYKPIIHTSSHMHIGHNNDLRIPCNKIFLPQVFITFIIRHVYFNEFEKRMNDDIFKVNYFNKISQNKKHKSVLNEDEKVDIHLSI